MEKYNDRNLIQKGYAVKVGTSSLVDQTESGYQVNHSAFDDIARQMSILNREGLKAFLVSSGAIALGKMRDKSLAEELDQVSADSQNLEQEMLHRGMVLYDIHSKNHTDEANHLQELYAQVAKYKRLAGGLGQHTLMTYWDDYFNRYGSLVGQVLYSNDMDMTTKHIQESYEWGRIPIINGDDTVNMFMSENNDDIAYRFAWPGNLNFDLLIFITKASGVLDKQKQVIPFCHISRRKSYKTYETPSGGVKVNNTSMRLPTRFSRQVGKFDKQDNLGFGGIEYKIDKAGHYAYNGGLAVITGLDYQDVILRTVQGERLGTWFYSRSGLIKKGRQRWVTVVDSGQVRTRGD